MAAGEIVYIDDFSVEVGIRGADTLIAGGAPPMLVSSASGYDLRGGESTTVQFQVQVDNPVVGVTSIDNTVFASSTEVGPVSASVSDTVISPLSTATIGDLVWDDVNGNGVFDGGEPGLENVRVELFDCGGDGCGDAGDVLVAVALTDAAGAYDFVGLPAGSYRVNVVEATLPVSYFLTGGPEPHDITIIAAQDYNLADFGYQQQLIAVPVTLSSLTSRREDGQLIVEWTTETEVGNVGFYVYGEVDGEWLELGDGLDRVQSSRFRTDPVVSLSLSFSCS